MKKLIIVAILVGLVVPAAYAASGKPDKSTSGSSASPAKACAAERKSLGVEAFAKKYGTNHNLRNAFGKCVSKKAKNDGDDDAQGNDQQGGGANAAKACKAERASLGVDAFAKKYGTNHNLRNAYGKCVSSHAKAKKKDSGEKDD